MTKTRLILIGLIVLAAVVVGVRAQERVDLSVPVTRANTTDYHLERITIDIDASTILVQLKGNNGETLSKAYNSTTTPTGASLISTLNTSNNSTTSLIKRVYNRLLADNVIAGSVSGTPQ